MEIKPDYPLIEQHLWRIHLYMSVSIHIRGYNWAVLSAKISVETGMLTMSNRLGIKQLASQKKLENILEKPQKSILELIRYDYFNIL